ncbi:hypothetical protein BDZ89DRAFT_581923 [Hymenopellis radicata]|nr:hypothetical protein BDZ89DRAFT_581923 [Hymenopellis radicata]
MVEAVEVMVVVALWSASLLTRHCRRVHPRIHLLLRSILASISARCCRCVAVETTLSRLLVHPRRLSAGPAPLSPPPAPPSPPPPAHPSPSPSSFAAHLQGAYASSWSFPWRRLRVVSWSIDADLKSRAGAVIADL